jgi:threonylcarbamoyladenosine tRNA methylthiotransferase MtaB
VRHLDSQQGATHRVLMESARLGRTEQFTEVAFDTDQPEGQIVLARIIGQAQGKLLAG